MGVAGGGGATRLCVELAATLASAGRDVAVLDAAFATQGLSQYATGPLDPDITALLTDGDLALADALVDHPAETAGRLALCPAYAPFERLARAKRPDAAQELARCIEDAASTFDRVLVDTPPLAANQAVAAVTAAERVALVAPDTTRGRDSLQRSRGRLADVGVSPTAVVANRVDGEPTLDADVAVPESGVTGVPGMPAVLGPVDDGFAPAVATAAERLLGTDLGLEFEDEGTLDAARRYLAGTL